MQNVNELFLDLTNTYSASSRNVFAREGMFHDWTKTCILRDEKVTVLKRVIAIIGKVLQHFKRISHGMTKYGATTAGL